MNFQNFKTYLQVCLKYKINIISNDLHYRSPPFMASDTLSMEKTFFTELSGWSSWAALLVCSPSLFTMQISRFFHFSHNPTTIISLAEPTYLFSLLFSRDWDDNPGVSNIERVKLSELEFPSVTVCPAFPTDSIATKTIYNRSGVLTSEEF